MSLRSSLWFLRCAELRRKKVICDNVQPLYKTSPSVARSAHVFMSGQRYEKSDLKDPRCVKFTLPIQR